MKLAALSFVLLAAAACGKSKPPATGNTGGTGPSSAGGVPAPWAEVFVEGATFTLTNGGGDGAEPTLVVATVTKVTRDDKGASAELTWKVADSEDAMGGLPTLVRVEGDKVTFGEGEGATPFPAPSPDSDQNGLYAHGDGDTVCYGEGPAPDAGDCEDVCFAELCVAAGRGIVSGAGTWWPNYEVFEQVAPK